MQRKCPRSPVGFSWITASILRRQIPDRIFDQPNIGQRIGIRQKQIPPSEQESVAASPRSRSSPTSRCRRRRASHFKVILNGSVVLPPKPSRSRRTAFRAPMTIGNPEPINPFGTHGGDKHTTSVADRRRRADRWLGGRPDAQRAATSKSGCPRRRTAGAGRDPERQAEQVERRHSSGRGGPGHREAGAAGARPERPAATRDIGRRSRTATEMSRLLLFLRQDAGRS